MGGISIAWMREIRNAHQILVGKPEGKRQEDSMKMNFERKVCEDVDWFHLAQDRDQWQGVVTW
jgi:hypothetical protein